MFISYFSDCLLTREVWTSKVHVGLVITGFMELTLLVPFIQTVNSIIFLARLAQNVHFGDNLEECEDLFFSSEFFFLSCLDKDDKASDVQESNDNGVASLFTFLKVIIGAQNFSTFTAAILAGFSTNSVLWVVNVRVLVKLSTIFCATFWDWVKISRLEPITWSFAPWRTPLWTISSSTS